MSVRRILLINMVALLVLLGVIYEGYNYYYQSTNYVSTADALVQGDEVPVQAEFAGNLTSWNAESGDTVTAGETLGKVDTDVEMQQIGLLAKDPKVKQSVVDSAQIQSPLNGTLLRSTVSAGQMVAPGQPLGYVVDLSKLYVVANVNETDLRHIEVGRSVDIFIDAFPNQTFKGTVESIGLAANSMFSLIPAADAASGTYTKVTQTVPVKVALSGYSGVNLGPGMSATVHIHRNND